MRSTLNAIAFAALVPILTVTGVPVDNKALNTREPCEVGVCPDMYGGYDSGYERVRVPEKRNAQDDPPPINLSDHYLACYAAYEGWQHDNEHAIEKRDGLERRCGKLKRDPQDYANYRPVKCYIEYDGGTGGGDGGARMEKRCGKVRRDPQDYESYRPVRCYIEYDGGTGGGDGGARMEKREEFHKRCGKYIREAESLALSQSEGPVSKRDAEKREAIDVWNPEPDPRYDEYHGPDADKRDAVYQPPVDPPRYKWYPKGGGPGPDPSLEERDALSEPQSDDYGDYHKYGVPPPEKRSASPMPDAAITPISIPDTYQASYMSYGTERAEDDGGRHLELRSSKE